MELKTGYKQTEIGVIPSDWEVKSIGTVCQIFGRIGFRGYTVNDIVEKDQGAITISPSNIQGDMMDFEKCTYISWFKYEESPEIKIFNGDILLVKTGSTFGKTAIVKNLNEKATINPQIVVLKKVLIDNYLLGYVMSHELVQNQITTAIVGGAIPTLSQKQVASFKIPLPPTVAEQTAIATALSDTDQYITHLEKLIAKKRNIKQGAMQELLKPKEGWVVKKLRDVADLIKEAIVPINFPNTQFSHFSLPAFDEGEKPTFESGAMILSNKFRVPKDAILVAKLNPRIPRVWMPVKVPENAIASTEFLVLLVKQFVTREYLYTICKSSHFFKQMELSVTGTTGSHQRINSNDAMRIEVWFPHSIETQTLIATILNDMDSEITTLETKLSKAQSIKQGMMQQLLTGKIRLT